MIVKDKSGKFTRVYELLQLVCACGNDYYSTENRLAVGRGKYCSKKCMYTYRSMPLGEEHHKWKGDEVGYHALHKWVAKHKGKPSRCEECNTTVSKSFQWANVSGKYKRDLSDWVRLCVKCHHQKDDITNRGWITRRLYNA